MTAYDFNDYDAFLKKRNQSNLVKHSTLKIIGNYYENVGSGFKILERNFFCACVRAQKVKDKQG